MRKTRRFAVAGLVAVGSILLSLFVAATPAQAYTNSQLDVFFARVDTDDCTQLGGTLEVDVDRFPDGCFLDDDADGTFFEKDPGGVALKIEVHHDTYGLVAKYEFHPYGEVHWIYDTRNDGDAVYVSIETFFEPNANDEGTFHANGPDAVDILTLDRSYAEGTLVTINVWDDANRTDKIAGPFHGTA